MDEWYTQTEEQNQTRVLVVGQKVTDVNSNTGIVVRIEEPDVNYTGAVYVWQDTKYVDDPSNCKHYATSEWKRQLRFV